MPNTTSDVFKTPAPVANIVKVLENKAVELVEEKAKEIAPVAEAVAQTVVKAVEEKAKTVIVDKVKAIEQAIEQKVSDLAKKLVPNAPAVAPKADAPAPGSLTPREEIDKKIADEKRRRWLLGYGRNQI